MNIVDIRPWASDDLSLLQRLMGDPDMTEHLGGTETPEKILSRHEGYWRSSASAKDSMFVIVVGPEKISAGSIGYWERDWQGQTVLETGWSVLPEFQGLGIAGKATAILLKRVRANGEHRFIHAFPSVDNQPSNAICRKAGFTLQAAINFEYPPGNFMRCNDWRYDLFNTASY